MGILKKMLKKNKKNNENIKTDTNFQTEPINANIQESLSKIKQRVGNSLDIVARQLNGGENNDVAIAILYTEGLADKNFVQDFILETLAKELKNNTINKQNCFEKLNGIDFPAVNIKQISGLDNLFERLLSGETIILVDGYGKCLSVDTRSWADRGVTEPSTQTVVRGPKDGFTETLRTNTALIRRRIKDPNLWIELRVIGRRTKTDVAIAYIKGVANDKVINELHERLDKIDIDGILESGYIEELIQESTFSPFPTVFNTERPDTVAAGLLEGRIAIMVDGTPFVLLIPALFIQFFQSSEDYYHGFDIGSLIRLLRFICFFFSLLVPSTFVAVTTFHQEMIPSTLLTSLAAQREGVPLPAFIEALMMEFAFEVLREAGIRMPRAMGNAISIVGALILGQAAVEAGVVSPIMVIIVSLTAICSFVSPTFNMAISTRILRFAFLILGATFGLFGISLGLIMLLLHLCSLRSFGVPYLYPIGLFNLKDAKDTIIRAPLKSMVNRPELINQNDVIRQGTNQQEESKSSNNK